MPGGPALDPRTVLAKDGKQWITKCLLGYAFGKMSNLARARDIAQEAITLALEAQGWHRWEPDPGKTPEQSLLGHLCNIARAIAKDERKSAAARREVRPGPEDQDRDLRVADPAPTIERANLDEAEHRETEDLARRVKDRLDARALGVLQLEEEGVHDASVQAERMGCTVREIYRARERIAHHRDAVLAQHGKASEKDGKEREP